MKKENMSVFYLGMKNISNKDFFSAFSGIIIIVFLFFVAAALADKYKIEMQTFVASENEAGMVAYIGLTILAVVFAPVSTLPLIPLASQIWGWFFAGILSIIGWTLGAQIAFLLARRFGKPLVKRIISLEKLQNIENRIPKHRLFLTVMFLRMTVPVDVLSYALGLFSQIKSVPYFFATFIGVIPFAFVFSSAGTLPLMYQIAAFGAVFFVMFALFLKKHYV